MEVLVKYLSVLVTGGIFCIIAQILIDKTKLTPARILVLYVVVGVILGGLGIYEKLIEFAGSGASVPLTGFGYVVSKGVKAAIDEKGWIGILTGPLTAASGGTTAALLCGYIACLIFKGKSK